jgi:YD repeat-containing protein
VDPYRLDDEDGDGDEGRRRRLPRPAAPRVRHPATRLQAEAPRTSRSNPTTKVDHHPAGQPLPSRPDTTHEYDTEQQLTTSTAADGALTSYGFDSRGNRTNATRGTFPVFVHYGVGLWVPEVGGAIDPGSDAHDRTLIWNQRICCTRYASTSGSTTCTGRIRGSRTSGR